MNQIPFNSTWHNNANTLDLFYPKMHFEKKPRDCFKFKFFEIYGEGERGYFVC